MCCGRKAILKNALCLTFITLCSQPCSASDTSFETALRAFLSAQTKDQRIEASRCVKHTASVLFGMTRQEWFMLDSRTRSRFRETIWKYDTSLSRLVVLSEGDDRVVALRLLGALGSKGRGHISLFRKFVSDQELPNEERLEAFFSLCQVAPRDESVVATLLPSFVDLLRESLEEPGGVNENEDERCQYRRSSYIVMEMARALILTDRAHTETPTLARLLSRECDHRIHVLVISILGTLGEDAEGAVQALRRHLRSPSSAVRRGAAHALAMITRNAASLHDIGRRAGLSGSELDAFVRYHSQRLMQAKLHVEQAAMAVREQPKELVPIYLHMIRYAPEVFKREAIVILREARAPAHMTVGLLRCVVDDTSLTRATRTLALSAINDITRDTNGEYHRGHCGRRVWIRRRRCRSQRRKRNR